MREQQQSKNRMDSKSSEKNMYIIHTNKKQSTVQLFKLKIKIKWMDQASVYLLVEISLSLVERNMTISMLNM